MRIRKRMDGALDFNSALWVGFWLYILQVGSPSLLDALVALVGRVAA